jgi:hypothetical protein
VKLFGTAYVAQEATFREEHAFTFKDADGKSYTNSLKLVPLSYKVKPTSFSSGGDWVIEWEGPAEDSKDEFVLEVSGDNVFAILNGQKMASNKVSFKPSRVMKPLKPGSYTVRLQRRRSGPLQQGASAGGNLIVVYSAEKIVVDVVE